MEAGGDENGCCCCFLEPISLEVLDKADDRRLLLLLARPLDRVEDDPPIAEEEADESLETRR